MSDEQRLADLERSVDLLCEVVTRLVIEIGQHQNPQVVRDLDMRPLQQGAERAVLQNLQNLQNLNHGGTVTRSGEEEPASTPPTGEA